MRRRPRCALIAFYVRHIVLGIVVGQYKGQNSSFKGLAWQLEVEFASHPGFKYQFCEGYFAEESDQPLELAYALMVHKSQGSQFGTTFLIVPIPCRLLSILRDRPERQRRYIFDKDSVA